MNKTKKRIIYAVITLVAVFGTGLTVFIVRGQDSKLKKHLENEFSPVQINIAVEENGDSTGTADKTTELTWEDSGDKLITAKSIMIQNVDKNKENNAPAYIRVTFVPHWITNATITHTDGSEESFVADTLSGTSIGNLKNLKLSEYATSFDLGSVTYTLNGNWSQYWIYNNNDGYFYYKYPVDPGKKTTELLQSVSIKAAVYNEAYKDLNLKIDVLADAIQTEGDAVSVRWADTGITVDSNGNLKLN